MFFISCVIFIKFINCKINNGYFLKKNKSEKIIFEKKKVISIINILICFVNLDLCEKYCECIMLESSISKIVMILIVDICIFLCIIYCKFVFSVLICYFCFFFINSI